MNAWRAAFLTTATTAVLAAQGTPSEWNDRGLEAAKRGAHAEAEDLYRQAIEGWKAKGPEFDAHLATTLLNLGQSYCAQGKRREASILFEESLVKYRRIFGVRNEWTLTAMNLLGAVYLMLGDSSRAAPLFEEALPLEREVLPANVQLARSLQGLATINLNAHNLDAALAQAEEALKVALAAEGEKSMDAAMAYATAAEVHRISHRYDRALPLYRKSRAIYETLLGPEHPRVASLLSQEGLILMTDGKYGLAEKDMVRSLEIVKKACPGCTYELWVGECNLGLLRYKQKRYAEADVLLSHSLEIQEKYTPHPGPDMVGTIQALAATREKLRRFEDARRLSQRATMLMSYH
jgi:tetratricopeptide (TPR) repeat protein